MQNKGKYKLKFGQRIYRFLKVMMDEIKRICERHGALLIEDVAEAMGATLNDKQCICDP